MLGPSSPSVLLRAKDKAENAVPIDASRCGIQPIKMKIPQINVTLVCFIGKKFRSPLGVTKKQDFQPP